MIIGAHSIIYSRDPGADRAFLRDVLRLDHVDVGGGWLIFGLPPAEVAVHPSEGNDVHEFYLMCDDVDAFVDAMNENEIACGSIQDLGWGRLTQLSLPGGGKLGVYEPRHSRPKATAVRKSRASRGRPSKVRTRRRTASRAARGRKSR